MDWLCRCKNTDNLLTDKEKVKLFHFHQQKRLSCSKKRDFSLFIVLFPLKLRTFAADMEIPSHYLDRAVGQFAQLPGIGRKTAMRLVLHLLKWEGKDVDAFAESLHDLAANVRYCKVCHNVCDDEKCQICASPSRDHSTICVVESVQDVMAIEATQQYNGVYHVLGGIISPMDGIGPQDLEIVSLVERVRAGGIAEVILALSPTMEGDTTSFYIFRKLADAPEVTITTLARGVAQNDQLHYTDELTLGRSIVDRKPFKS